MTPKIAPAITEAPPKAAFSVAQTVGQGREIPYGYRKPSLKDYGDVMVALVCLAVMVGVAYFSEVDSNYATAMRISAAIQRVLGVPTAARGIVDTRRTIVVVEKDEGQRLIAKTALERYGYNVALADNETEAAGLLHKGAGRVALVVLDAGSANVRGMQQLKDIRPHVPILVAEPAGEKLHPGATARIDRPFAALPLAAAVQKVLSARAL
jgi:CheY-like chemotaxis protein